MYDNLDSSLDFYCIFIREHSEEKIQISIQPRIPCSGKKISTNLHILCLFKINYEYQHAIANRPLNTRTCPKITRTQLITVQRSFLRTLCQAIAFDCVPSGQCFQKLQKRFRVDLGNLYLIRSNFVMRAPVSV